MYILNEMYILYVPDTQKKKTTYRYTTTMRVERKKLQTLQYGVLMSSHLQQ